jgi:hypothetical protein
MGNVHWSANFNEIQDFDNDVYFRFHDGNPPPPGPAGSSFTTNPNAPLAANNAGRDIDLDRLSDYVTSLTKVSRSPFRNADGTLTAKGAAGEAVFTAKNCQKCHKGRNFTDSQIGTGAPSVDVFPQPAGAIILHNVGTLKATSGGRLGGALPGIDTPTLKGLWQSAPYFHDGHAATLQDVFDDASAATHFGGPLTAQEKSDLVEYMLEIDEIDAPPVDPLAAPPTVTLDFVSTGKPYSLMAPVSGCLPWIDRSYVMGSWPGVAGQFTLIRTAEDDKDLTTLNHMQVTVTGDSYIHILYDMRKTALPDWMITGGWSTTPVTTLAFPGQNVTMGFFFLHLPAGGTVMLGGNMAPGAAGALRNYFVAVYQPNPTPVVVNEGPLNKNEWAHDHDADGDGLRDQYEVASATDPFHADTGALGTIPDEDRLAPSGKTFFEDQVDFDAAQAVVPPPASGGGGGGGGCGFLGLEPILLAGLAVTIRRRVRGPSTVE